ncbi:MAG: transposase [Pseudomonadota bacterium]|nr:transposase [Pseudomonadota bacterium]
MVDFELFRPELEAALDRADRSRGGRPPYDAVLMFRILVLQTLYTLSDDQAEYQLRDRLSFMRFAGLALHDMIPDAKHALGQAEAWRGDDLAVSRAADAQRQAGPDCSSGSTGCCTSVGIWRWADRSSTRR